MTYLLKLTGPAGEYEIDMTAMHPAFTFSYNNPIIVIPIPMDPDATIEDPKNTWAPVVINLNMSEVRVMITFQEMSGIGNDGAAPSFSSTSATTVFEKMLALCTQFPWDKKKLFVNSDTTEFSSVEIADYRARVDPGNKDLVQHDLTLVLCNNRV
jgi:hypothetical protein